MSRISIIVPVYFNADTLEDLYRDMAEKILPKLEDYELVKTDGSTAVFEEIEP